MNKQEILDLKSLVTKQIDVLNDRLVSNPIENGFVVSVQDQYDHAVAKYLLTKINDDLHQLDKWDQHCEQKD